jgi:hypothetical protein
VPTSTSSTSGWWCGPPTGGPAFTHNSCNDDQVVFANLVESRDVSVDHRQVSYAVFTDPQFGRVGMTVLGTLMLAGAPYTLLKKAIYIHSTLTEGFRALMEEVRPVAPNPKRMMPRPVSPGHA